MRVSELAEILYHARVAKLGKLDRTSAGIMKMHVEYIEVAATKLLAEVGVDPGRTADDADRLKVAMMGVERGTPAYEILRPRTRPADTEGDETADLLDTVSRVTGSDDPFRELGRLQEFCMRARFSGIIEDDPTLPVRPWLDARKAVLTDITTATRLYVEWQREACRLFEQQQRAEHGVTL